MKEYKVYSYGKNTINTSEVLVALLCEIHRTANTESIDISRNCAFIFSIDSNFAYQIIADPQNTLLLDLNDFKVREIDIENIDHSYGYFHNKLIPYNAQKLNYIECIFSCHPDMFFYRLFKFVYNKEFAEQSKSLIRGADIYDRFLDVASVVLMDSFQLLTSEFKKLSNEEKFQIRNSYNESVEYAKDFTSPISLFVESNDEAKKIAKLEMSHKSYIPSNYIQNVIVTAFAIAKSRIEKNLNCNSFLGHELMIGSNNIQLIIFPTLYAFERPEEIPWNNGELIIEYLQRKDIVMEKATQLDLDFSTKYIFKHQDFVQPFFNDLANSLSLSEFGRQKRSRIGESIFRLGQINFTMYQN